MAASKDMESLNTPVCLHGGLEEDLQMICVVQRQCCWLYLTHCLYKSITLYVQVQFAVIQKSVNFKWNKVYSYSSIYRHRGALHTPLELHLNQLKPSQEVSGLLDTKTAPASVDWNVFYRGEKLRTPGLFVFSLQHRVTHHNTHVTCNYTPRKLLHTLIHKFVFICNFKLYCMVQTCSLQAAHKFKFALFVISTFAVQCRRIMY